MHPARIEYHVNFLGKTHVRGILLIHVIQYWSIYNLTDFTWVGVELLDCGKRLYVALAHSFLCLYSLHPLHRVWELPWKGTFIPVKVCSARFIANLKDLLLQHFQKTMRLSTQSKPVHNRTEGALRKGYALCCDCADLKYAFTLWSTLIELFRNPLVLHVVLYSTAKLTAPYYECTLAVAWCHWSVATQPKIVFSEPLL